MQSRELRRIEDIITGQTNDSNNLSQSREIVIDCDSVITLVKHNYLSKEASINELIALTLLGLDPEQFSSMKEKYSLVLKYLLFAGEAEHIRRLKCYCCLGLLGKPELMSEAFKNCSYGVLSLDDLAKKLKNMTIEDIASAFPHEFAAEISSKGFMQYIEDAKDIWFDDIPFEQWTSVYQELTCYTELALLLKEYIEKHGEQKSIEKKFQLGLLYFDGFVKETENEDQAYELISFAAQHGHEKALRLLIDHYANALNRVSAQIYLAEIYMKKNDGENAEYWINLILKHPRLTDDGKRCLFSMMCRYEAFVKRVKDIAIHELTKNKNHLSIAAKSMVAAKPRDKEAIVNHPELTFAVAEIYYTAHCIFGRNIDLKEATTLLLNLSSLNYEPCYPLLASCLEKAKNYNSLVKLVFDGELKLPNVIEQFNLIKLRLISDEATISFLSPNEILRTIADNRIYILTCNVDVIRNIIKRLVPDAMKNDSCVATIIVDLLRMQFSGSANCQLGKSDITDIYSIQSVIKKLDSKEIVSIASYFNDDIYHISGIVASDLGLDEKARNIFAALAEGDESLQELISIADVGCKTAQFLLGCYYYHCDEQALASKYFEQAANRNHLLAQAIISMRQDNRLIMKDVHKLLVNVPSNLPSRDRMVILLQQYIERLNKKISVSLFKKHDEMIACLKVMLSIAADTEISTMTMLTKIEELFSSQAPVKDKHFMLLAVTVKTLSLGLDVAKMSNINDTVAESTVSSAYQYN